MLSSKLSTVVILLISILFNNLANAQLIPKNVLTTKQLDYIYRIEGETRGTCFLVIKNEKNYLVTARHLFSKSKNGDTVNFSTQIDTEWNYNRLPIFLHRDKRVDIAIFPLTDVKGIPAILLDEPSTMVGGQGFFLGYPLGIYTTVKNTATTVFRLRYPLVKVCNLSGIRQQDSLGESLLDGHNNPGFSGGPVFFPDITKSNDSSMQLYGVISGYIDQIDTITTQSENIQYKSNSGIISCWRTEYILDIIEANKL